MNENFGLFCLLLSKKKKKMFEMFQCERLVAILCKKNFVRL